LWGDVKRNTASVVHIWDVEQGKATGEYKQQLDLRDPDKNGYLDGLGDLAFSPDGKRLTDEEPRPLQGLGAKGPQGRDFEKKQKK